MKNTEIAKYAMFIALACIAGYIETLIPLPIPIYGIKLGLANIIVVIVLYIMTPMAAVIVSLLRIIIISFMFGNMMMLIYSLSGALLSLFVMSLLKKTNCFSIIGISMAGGVFHNIGQIIAAGFSIGFLSILGYIPVLIIAGIITGIIIGIISGQILIRLNINGGHDDFIY